MDGFVHISELEKRGRVKALYSRSQICRWPVFENEGSQGNDYDILAQELGITPDAMLRLPQVHSASIRVIDGSHTGEGVVRPVSILGYDGMITKSRRIALCTVEADCIPVYLFDPVKEVVGMVHSGWKGTSGGISREAVRLMQEEFSCSCKDIVAYIGPGICGNCYEVGGELKEEFLKSFSESETESFFTQKDNGKYLLDLKKAVVCTLLHSGLLNDHITDPGICTYESADLCSWRRDADKTARMLTAIMLI